MQPCNNSSKVLPGIHYSLCPLERAASGVLACFPVFGQDSSLHLCLRPMPFPYIPHVRYPANVYIAQLAKSLLLPFCEVKIWHPVQVCRVETQNTCHHSAPKTMHRISTQQHAPHPGGLGISSSGSSPTGSSSGQPFNQFDTCTQNSTTQLTHTSVTILPKPAQLLSPTNHYCTSIITT